MNDTTALSEHKTQGIEVTKEIIELLAGSVHLYLLDYFQDTQTEVSLDVAGQRLISRALSRAFSQLNDPSDQSTTVTVS